MMQVRIKGKVLKVLSADAFESDACWQLTIKPCMEYQMIFIQWGMPYYTDGDGNWTIEVTWQAIEAMFDFDYE